MQGPAPEKIQAIFASVAHGYDRANDAMTFGLARRWRRELVRWSGVRHGESVIDCATGTGDLALEFKSAVGPQGRVVGTDFCEEMLVHAREKSKARHTTVEWSVADAQNLPFEDNTFDVASMAYGIRNVQDPLKALSEMARVVKKGGRVLILETGDSPALMVKPFVQFYFHKVVPRLGGWITGERRAYEYLSQSSQGFPSRERFLELMKSTGRFSDVQYRSLFFGASFIYNGKVK